MKTEGRRICCIHVIGEQLSGQLDSKVFACSNSSEAIKMTLLRCPAQCGLLGLSVWKFQASIILSKYV